MPSTQLNYDVNENLLSDTKNSFKQSKNYIDIKEIEALQGAKLIFHNGFLINSDNETIKNFLNQWCESNKFLQIAFINEKITRYHGRSILTLDITKNNSIICNIALPLIINRLDLVNFVPMTAKIYFRQVLDNTIVWTRGDYTHSQTKYYEAREDLPDIIGDKATDNKISFDFSLKKQIPHNFDFLPVVNFINVPYYNYYINSYYYQYADDKNVANLPALINQIFMQLEKENMLNKSRFYGKLKKDALSSTVGDLNHNKVLADFAESDIYLETLVNNTLESNLNGLISQANPQFASYKQAIMDIIDIYMESCGISYRNNSDAVKTSSEVQLSQKSDDLNIKWTKNFRQMQYLEFFDKLLKMQSILNKDNKLLPFIEKKRQYSFEIKDADIINTAENQQLWTDQYHLGILSKVELISKLRNISLNEAKTTLDNIKTEAENEPPSADEENFIKEKPNKEINNE